MRQPPLHFVRRLAAFLLGMFAAHPVEGAEAPLDLQQSTLTFTGHAFLHDFDGKARDFHGSAEVDSGAPNLVTQAIIQIQTPGLTTLQETRDRNMRDWLHVSTDPEMVFHLLQIYRLDGDPPKATRGRPARFQIRGTFTLNRITRALGAEAQGWREGQLLFVTGATKIDTVSYSLPIIRQLFMTVDPIVDVTFHLVFRLPPGTRGPAPR